MFGTAIETQIEGYSFQLLSGGGVYWDRESTLFVADAHLGKEATFRKHGLPVPDGSSEKTLGKLTKMLQETQAKRLLILGDLFHARSSLAETVRSSLELFFKRFSNVEMRLVIGNHDKRVGRLPESWPLLLMEEGEWIDSIAVGHHPSAPPDGASLYLCGHLHPAVRVPQLQRGKIPCFWYSNGCLVLPALGDFTGTHEIKVADREQAWMVLEDCVIPYSKLDK